MKLQIFRQAVCAADDQMGPLELEVEVPESALLSDVVHEINRSRFLQFSSSHTVMTGFSGGRALFRLFSPYSAGQCDEYLISADEYVKEVISNGVIEFKF